MKTNRNNRNIYAHANLWFSSKLSSRIKIFYTHIEIRAQNKIEIIETFDVKIDRFFVYLLTIKYQSDNGLNKLLLFYQ